jgi:hypothetical protein
MDDAKILALLMQRVEVEKEVQDCIDRGFVPEATAVAAAAIRPDKRRRRVLVVVDVGAGTSVPSSRSRRWELASSSVLVGSSPESRKNALQLRWRTGLGVPLLHAGEVIGLI